MYKKTKDIIIAGMLAFVPVFADEGSLLNEAAETTLKEMSNASEPVQLSENELIELVGYLTALGGGVASLELDDASVKTMAEGLHQALSGKTNLADLDETSLEEAFAQAQARANAVQAEADLLPAISTEALNQIGAVMVIQSGLDELGFGANEADAIKRGFISAANIYEPDPSFEAKMPAFQEFMQTRFQAAQAKSIAAQASKQEAALAEFEEVASEWRAKEDFNVVLETSQGDITIELFPSVAPLAVANFVGHIENGYYDNLIFHRVIETFMIQGGDPLGNGTGGESIWGKDFPDEISETLTFDSEGLLAMANRGPMTNGSQFFITTSQPEWLHGRHTIFGKVVKGYENVRKIASVQTGAQDKPIEDQKILKAYVAE